MDMYQKYTSPFGYQTGTGGIDTYGVNHNKFSLRDEIDYQFARQKRENELQAQYNAQGITENYPQYTTNFWGNAANNIGLQVEQLPMWRAAGSTLGKFFAKNGLKTVKQGINSFADKMKNMYYNNDEDEKKYHY